MDNKRPLKLPSETIKEVRLKKDSLRNARGDFSDSSSSHTQIYSRKIFEKDFTRIIPGLYSGTGSTESSDTFQCIHGPEGKPYTKDGALKRLMKKKLDPINIPRDALGTCPLVCGWEVAECLAFLVSDPAGRQQTERIENCLQDFAALARHGYKVEVLKNLCVVLDYLMENLGKLPNLRKGTVLLLQNMDKPILLTRASDVVTQFDSITDYIGFLGYLLIRVEDDELFNLVSRGVLWQMSACGDTRKDAVQYRHILAAAPVLMHTAVRMLALATSARFSTYLQIALILACDSMSNCVEMLNENILENIFYRFNPYFPIHNLPDYEENPLDPQDYNVILGDSSINMQTTLSLLLVLLKSFKNYLKEYPSRQTQFPCPDYYAQRCFIWAYHIECRARGHQHERNCLTVVAHVLLHCFGNRLMAFSTLLMPDIMTLSVLTEIPPRNNWTQTVNFNTAEADVHFKKLLIYLSVDFLKVLPVNMFMVESQYWLLGLMFLLDPGLCPLRARWSPALFSEIRKTAFQALVSTMPNMPPKLIKEYEIIRRIMWYIEWYSESPFELPVLYWCVRLLQVSAERNAVSDLFNTHGIVIMTHLCNTLLRQKRPPVEKSQVVLSVCMRVLATAAAAREQVTCCVYPGLRWPDAGAELAHNMLAVVLYSLGKHLIISDRWLISLLNFIWEAIIWKQEYLERFIKRDGVYNLLDIASMSKPPVQCIALAILCDVARAGRAVAQLVTWRASAAASDTYPNVVKRGSTIASLLASVFRDECRCSGVQLDENGFILNMESPLQTSDMLSELSDPQHHVDKSQRTPTCCPAAESAGSRASKAFALLHLLSEDLKHKVALADETYNMYKNIQLKPDEEVVLVLCSYYLTVKVNETWREIKRQSQGLLPEDEEILNEFLELNTGWAKTISREQQDVLEESEKNEEIEERSLYSFLSRVRLNTALDALREVRCAARSAHVRYATAETTATTATTTTTTTTTFRTYRPPLDEQNITGQYVKVQSIYPKKK